MSSPVGLKEAALDSPTFRSSFTHFSEQLELLEKWLEGCVRSITRFSQEAGAFEIAINGIFPQMTPPSYVSEAVLDHDYTLLAIKRYGEGAKEFWSSAISGLRKMELNMVEPIKAFLQNDLRSFRETRRNLDQTQRQLDNLQSRFSGQGKSKELSSLREDAFQLHEARRAYLKASMDFSVAAPQLKMASDRLLVKVFSDQWRDTKGPGQSIYGPGDKWGSDIERVRGWSREMENGEKSFKRELQNARKQIEESAEAAIRPSRELEDYATGPSSMSTSRGPSTTNLPAPGSKPRSIRAEKQGWLNLRTVSGKPSRTIWLRRWFYVKNGIFGWLVQGSRSGGVEESERIGVLLCNVKPGNADDRRYVFEVKTKDTTIVVQAETQPEMAEWLAAFEVAKQKALEDPKSTESPGLGPRSHDPAFAISPPSAPEFAASTADSGMPQHAEESSSVLGVDRSSTLPVPGGDPSANRSSFDVTNHRRPYADKDADTSRDPASRIIQKLDLHRKVGGNDRGAASPGLSGGGIASLIAASHTSMSVGPGSLPTPPVPETPALRKPSAPISLARDLPTSSLAPNTLANPPAPTNLSSAAVVVKGERNIGIGRTDCSGGMPSGIMANIWGSTNWGHVNRLARGELVAPRGGSVIPKLSSPPSPLVRPANPAFQSPNSPKFSTTLGADESIPRTTAQEVSRYPSATPSPLHRKTVSLEGEEKPEIALPEYPNYYPIQLKTQDAQFRLLFPDVRRSEKLVLVFKATWNPNEQQEFPGRVYVTNREIYFYSNHCGMTLISSIDLDSISEVTAATGRDCDFIFCHLKYGQGQSHYTRITIKTFLEPLNLLQRRLNFLIRNRSSTQESSIEDVLKNLIRMEGDDPESGSSVESWENVSINTPTDGSTMPIHKVPRRNQRDLKTNLLIDRGLYGEGSLQPDGPGDGKTFKLPKQPIVYAPAGMGIPVVEKVFEVSPKALFHVMFGDKSAVWQLLYHERRAQRIRQGPWAQSDRGHLRREFDYEIDYMDALRRTRQAHVADHQMIDVANKHLLYVVSDRKTPWHLPYRNDFLLLTKVVITHFAKSKCKLAVYVKVDWTKTPSFARSIIDEAALKDLELDALDLTDVIAEQVRNFSNAHGRTKKAIQIFGQVGAQTQVSEFAGSDAVLKAQLRRSAKPRTLTALAFESIASIAESILTSTIQIILKLFGWAWKTINANTLLLTILAFSVLLNVIISSSSTSDWWRERKARRFMTRLGVGPDLTMSKAIYLHDLKESTSLGMVMSPGNSNQCRDTFNSIMSITDVDAPESLSLAKPAQTATLRRLRRSRHHLGTHRHDLIVALRVVNNIEKEMVEAEWESWLLEESANCRQVAAMITQNFTKLSTMSSGEIPQSLAANPRRLEEVRTWHKGYCESCSKEQEILGFTEQAV